MKITQVRAFPMPMGDRDFLICQVDTDEGITGIGEPYPAGQNRAVVAVIEEFSEWVAGKDPRDITGIWQGLFNYSRFPGGAILYAAMSGIEHALWDVAARAAEVPVYRMLGGRCRDRVRAYQTVAGTNALELAASAVTAIERFGFTALKISPFPVDWGHMPWRAALRAAYQRVEAVRNAAGPDVEISVDVHAQLFEVSAALELARVLAPLNLAFMEEPLRPENPRALALLRARCPIPIATGEMLYLSHGFREIIEFDAVDIVQPDICLCGGLLEMRKIAALAETHYMTVAPHNPTGPLATAVNVHFAASTPNFSILEYVPDVDGPRSAVLEEPIRLVDGYLQIPEGPGWGVSLNDLWHSRAAGPELESSRRGQPRWLAVICLGWATRPGVVCHPSGIAS